MSRARWSCALLAVLCAAAALLGPAPAASAASTAPGAEEAARDSGVDVVLESLGPGAVGPADQVAVRLRVTNGTTASVEGAQVRLFVDSPVLADREAVRAWAEGEGPQGGDRFVAGAEVPLPSPLPAGGAVVVDVVVPAAALALGPQWGPRGITVDLWDAAAGQRLDAVRSFLVWLPDGPPVQSTGLTVLVPLSAGPPDVLSGLVPPARTAELTATGGRLDRVLRAAAAPGVALVLDPAVLEAAAVPDAPPATAEWLQRLRGQADAQEVVSLPQADPDVAALAAAAEPELLRLAQAQGRTRVQASLGAPARSDVAWPVGGTADVALLDLLQTTTPGTALVAPTASVPGAVEAGRGGTAPVRVDLAGDGERPTTPALVVDADLSAQLVAGTGRTAVGALPADAPRVTARLLAESAAAALSGPGAEGGSSELLLALPRDWDPAPEVATTVLGALRAAPWVRVQSLADLLSTPAAAELPVPAAAPSPGALPADGLDAVAAGLARMREVASALTDPEPRRHEAEVGAVAAASSGWRADPAAWREQLSRYAGLVGEVDAGVRVVPGSAVTVIASQVVLPVTLENTLRQDVQVEVSLRSTSLRLVPGEPVAVTLAAGAGAQRVELPVRAVASGDTELDVVVTTPDGVPIGQPVPLEVRVRADWEGRGVAVVAVLLAGVLVVGLVRTVRRGRRAPSPEAEAGRG